MSEEISKEDFKRLQRYLNTAEQRVKELTDMLKHERDDRDNAIKNLHFVTTQAREQTEYSKSWENAYHNKIIKDFA